MTAPVSETRSAHPQAAAEPVFDDAFRRSLTSLMAWRRDVRRFRRDPLPDGILDDLLAQAATAPSVGLSEPWRFVLVESAPARATVRASFERENATALAERDSDAALYAGLKLAGLDAAPVQIAAFCADDTAKGRGLGVRTMPEMRAYSVVCAVMQLWLGARAHGIGLGWVSILDPAEVARACRADPDWRLIAYLCLGYPEDTHLDCELERAGWEHRDRLADRLTRA
ncbi:MAG: 5,6-dimethylbenzimidazole synthase [Pseudomonadota bacterium]